MIARILAFILLVISISPAWSAKKEIRIGVLAFRGIEKTKSLWTPTAKYLSDSLPQYRFTIIPLDQTTMQSALRRGELDFVLTNTGHYVELEAQFGITRIATLVNKHRKHDLTKFGAVIFTRADNKSINTIADLRNKSLMAVKPQGFGGFRMTWYEMMKASVDPHRELKKLKFSGFPVDKIAHAVLNKEVDAGTFRTGILERLHKEKKINIKNFKIIAKKKHPDFDLLVSTDLYPEWPFAKTKVAPPELTERIAIALLRLGPDSLAAKEAGINGWTVPLDYQSVHVLYKKLKVGPYKNLGKFTVKDILREYWYVVLITIVVILFLSSILVYIVNLDKKVRKSEYSLAKAQEIAHIGNWEWQVEKNLMHWSTEIFHIFGISQNGKSISIEDFLECIYEDDRDFVKATLNDSLYRSKPFNIDHRIVTRDGTVRVVHQQAEQHLNEAGKVVSMTGILQDITERKSAEDRLRESEQELASILNNMQDTFFRISNTGTLVSISPSVEQLLGYSMHEVLNKRITRFLDDPWDRKEIMQAFATNMGRIDNFEVILRHKNGTSLTVAVSAHVFYDEFGDGAGIEGIGHNITELIHTRDDLTKEKERIQTTLESIGDGVITTDVTGVVEYMNAVGEQMTGWSLVKARGMPLFNVFDVVESHIDESIESTFNSVLKQETREAKVIHDAILQSKDQGRYFVEITMAAIQDHEGRLAGTVIVFHDVTEVREMAKRMAYHAKHDALTGLINRRELEERLERVLSQPEKLKTQHAMLYIDINDFKQFNEDNGHVAGDELLKQLADQFKAKIRESDTLARITGDEFAVLLQNCPVNQATSIGESILGVVKEFRFSWGDKVFQITINMGLVVIEDNNLTVADIFNAGDVACHKAKETGTNNLQVYTPDSKLVERRTLEKQWVAKIDSAIDENRLQLYQQKVVALGAAADEVPYYEILVRLLDEKNNIVLPMAFMSSAERFKIMSRIDRWVVESTLKKIEELGKENKYFNCMINISSQSLGNREFVEHVVSLLEDNAALTKNLCFEISESAALSHYADASKFFTQMQELGCRCALDDFGNGVSSFTYMKTLPVDCIKIDGALIRGIADNVVEYSIVESINNMAHVMGKTTVAKCVENDRVLDKLKLIGVDFVQGYGLEKPQPLDDLSGEIKKAKAG